MRRVRSLLRMRFVLAAVVGMLLLPGRPAGQDIVDDECFDVEGACDVEGVSAILASTDANEIDTYSATSISLDLLDNAFEADVVGHLFLNDTNNEIDSAEGFDDGSGLAEADMADGVELGNAYGLGSEHNLIDLLSGDTIPIGTSFVSVDAAAPDITSINPPQATSGTSGQLVVDGFDLFDQFDGSVGVSQIPGITWSANSAKPDGTEIVLNYSIAANATSGDYDFFLATRFGQSNTVVFHIDDPPPSVTSVQPPNWEAGAQTSITIGGKGFGACPKLKISGPGVSGSSITSFTDTQIQGTVTVDASSTGGQATVDVTSGGEMCNGFHGPPGSSGDASDTAEIDPFKPPAPQIQYFNTTSLPQTVMAGQKISLSMVPPKLPGDLQVSTLTWTVGGTAIASFTAGSAGNPSQGDKATPFQQNVTNNAGTPGITFYWVSAGQSPPASYNVSLSYTANNQQNSDTTTVSFNVDAPHLPAKALNITTDSVQIYNSTRINPDTGLPIGPILQFGKAPANGITFVVQGNAPQGNQGSYQWVQLITTDKVKMITDDTNPGPRLTCSSFFTPGGAPELDSVYPYTFGLKNTNGVPGDTVVDAPGSGLGPLRGLVQRVFVAQLNLRWIPTADSANCGNDSSCAIPVPLGSVTWGYSGCAINSFQSQLNGTNWVPGGPNCPQNSQGGSLQFQTITPSSGNNFGYPTWSNTTTHRCNPFPGQ